MRYEEELTFADIGRRLNMLEATAKTYFYRACKKLRTILLSEQKVA
jgi:DNA-directed RNA polymerase specialized sigma24 family protein